MKTIREEAEVVVVSPKIIISDKKDVMNFLGEDALSTDVHVPDKVTISIGPSAYIQEDGESREETKERAKHIIRDSYPTLTKYTSAVVEL